MKALLKNLLKILLFPFRNTKIYVDLRHKYYLHKSKLFETAITNDPPKTLSYNAQIILNSAYFDENWYVEMYQLPNDVHAAEHYCNIGWRLGYDPSIFFSSHNYLTLYPDIKAADINPLVHFEIAGKHEFRKIVCSEFIKHN